MQSHSSSKAAGREPLPLAWGLGSMSFHGRCWWLTYKDVSGKPVFENSKTDDAEEARRLWPNGRYHALARRSAELSQ